MATTPRLTASSRRARYFDGVSPSCLSGIISGSLTKLKDWDLEPVDIGVPGKGGWIWPVLEVWGSEFCRKREMFNKPPRLDLPVVEDEFRPDEGRGGVGIASSSGKPLKDPLVELRLFLVRRAGCAETGEDLPDGGTLKECLGELGLLGELKFGAAPSTCVRDGLVGVGSPENSSKL